MPCSPFEAAVLLQELPDPLSGTLWQIARDVALWSAIEPGRRADLFASDQAARPLQKLGTDIPELAAAVQVFTALIRRPAETSVHELVSACGAVSEWAGKSGYLETSAYFAELAAHVDPRNASLATAAGRANREIGAYPRATRWLDRAITIFRRRSDAAGMAEVYLTWGNMAFRLSDYSRARRLFTRAETKARRNNRKDLGAAARHNLLALEFAEKDYEAAMYHAFAAFALYGEKHGRLPYLAHDVAHLLATEGYYALALSLLQASASMISAPQEQVKVWANIGRAAAGAGDTEQFLHAWSRVSEAAGESESPHLSEAFLAIADGATLLGRTGLAGDVAERALQAAIRRKNVDAERMARERLEWIRSGRKPPPPARPPDRVIAFAHRLMRALGG